MSDKVMLGLIYLVGLFDPYGKEHAERVSVLACKLAVRCGVKDLVFLETIRKASLIHDVGKMGVPEYVRRMTGRYLAGEREMMNAHAMQGYQYLEVIMNGVITEDLALMVKHHHEDWNGSGYPDKLKGSKIPYGARIIRPCDWFDAVTHERGYKRASTKKEALEEMVDVQIEYQPFDPEMLRAFIEMVME